MKITLSCLLLAVILVLFGCQEEADKPHYIYQIVRVNPDGTTENWVVKDDVKVKEGFVIWTHENGGQTAISGTITVYPILATTTQTRTEKKE